MSELFAKFLKEKQFLCIVSPKIIRSYQQAFNSYQRVLKLATSKGREDQLPTKEILKDFVIGMRGAGLSPVRGKGDKERLLPISVRSPVDWN